MDFNDKKNRLNAKIKSIDEKIKKAVNNFNFEEAITLRNTKQKFLFNYIDTNNDNFIIDIELLLYFKTNNNDVSASDVQVLIDILDDNSDKKLSLHEWIKQNDNHNLSELVDEMKKIIPNREPDNEWDSDNNKCNKFLQ